MNKIKEKKPFGEKHRLRRQQQSKRNEQLIAHNKKTLEASKKWLEASDKRFEESRRKHREFLANQPWYQRILALNPGDPCEFYQCPDWHPAVFVQHVVEPDGERRWWRVRDAIQGAGLRVRHVRSPGDQDAFPGLNASNSERLEEIQRTVNRAYTKLGEAHLVIEGVVPDLEFDTQVLMSNDEG